MRQEKSVKEPFLFRGNALWVKLIRTCEHKNRFFGYFDLGKTLAWGGGPEKCSSVISDENLIDILNMSEAVVKPATSMMLPLPEMIAKSNALAEK